MNEFYRITEICVKLNQIMAVHGDIQVCLLDRDEEGDDELKPLRPEDLKPHAHSPPKYVCLDVRHHG
jgi:hypothetical protein